MARVEKDPVVFAPGKPAWGGLWLRFSVGLALLGMATVFVNRFSNTVETAPEPVVASVEASTNANVQLLEIQMPKISAEQVEELTLKLDNPLEKELENVISDTRQAIKFIASNFLPEQ